MKRITYILILLCSINLTLAQIQEENFNATTIPAGWSSTNTSSCDWQFGYTGPLVGSGTTNPSSFPSGGVIFDDNACGTGIANRLELEGPEIDLVAANVTSAAIEIIYNHQAFVGDGDFLVEVWDGSAWQTVLTVDNDAPAPNSGTNATSVIDVTTHINANFKVKFIYDDEHNPPTNNITLGVGIDDYKLIDTATASIDDLISDGFSYYPNPVIENNLTLNAKEVISDVIVYNVLGQTVYKSQPNALQSNIRMSHLPVGSYIVNVAVGEKKGTFKILKQ